MLSLFGTYCSNIISELYYNNVVDQLQKCNRKNLFCFPTQNFIESLMNLKFNIFVVCIQMSGISHDKKLTLFFRINCARVQCLQNDAFRATSPSLGQHIIR